MSQLDRDYARRQDLLELQRIQRRNQVNAGVFLYAAGAGTVLLVWWALDVLARSL